MTKTYDAREIVFEILTEILEKGSYSHIVLKQALDKYQFLEKHDRAFISRVVEGTIEYLLQIDEIINSYSKTPVKKMKPVIRTILRMSVYQLLYMDRIPDSAVCNEAVKLAQKRKFTGLKGFVNGVLRTISREKTQLSFKDLSIKYSIPQWILRLWKDRYEDDTVEMIAKSFLEKKKFFVRFNYHKADKETIISSLNAQSVRVIPTEFSDSVYQLDGIDYPEALDAFNKGYIQVQDLSSSFVGDIISPQKGSYVIDVCGAPGGKSIHVADLLEGSGMVEVRDLTEYKINLIDSNIERCQFHNIRSKVQDALEFDPESEGKADIVIADLPCSGLGIIGKKPDIKYRMSLEQIEELVKLQRDILSVVSRYVKPGGLLCYSTCTIDYKENEENAAWIKNHLHFTPVDLTGRLGKIEDSTMQQGYLQILPGIYPCDGFFISLFRKEME